MSMGQGAWGMGLWNIKDPPHVSGDSNIPHDIVEELGHRAMGCGVILIRLMDSVDLVEV